jgi:hypothetical protein
MYPHTPSTSLYSLMLIMPYYKLQCLSPAYKENPTPCSQFRFECI